MQQSTINQDSWQPRGEYKRWFAQLLIKQSIYFVIGDDFGSSQLCDSYHSSHTLAQEVLDEKKDETGAKIGINHPA